ncbi:MAG TPA: hypothetical protein V6C78_01255 [Crinalium sp.]
MEKQRDDIASITQTAHPAINSPETLVSFLDLAIRRRSPSPTRILHGSCL